MWPGGYTPSSPELMTKQKQLNHSDFSMNEHLREQAQCKVRSVSHSKIAAIFSISALKIHVPTKLPPYYFNYVMLFIYESFSAFVVRELYNMKKFAQTELDIIKYSICLYLLKNNCTTLHIALLLKKSVFILILEVV